MYPDKDEAPVYCSDCWYGDKWDQFINGKEYDFSKPFFEQLKELFKINPRFYSYKFGRLINSEFTNFSTDNKNAYLSYSVIGSEDVLYSENINKSKNSVDCFSVNKIDGCYFNIECESNYNTDFAVISNNCIDSYFIYDCLNCQNCCLSSNLRNQKYIFKNEKISKENYEKAVAALRLDTYSGRKDAENYFSDLIANKTIHKYAFIYNAQNVSGDYIYNARNIKKSFILGESENIAYSFRVLDRVRDSYDLLGIGFDCELIYESMAATSNTYKDFFCYITIQGSRECEYSLILKNCSNCFGCVGLTNAKYCILNRQYSEKEYFGMVEKIKKHMMEMPYIDKKERVYKYGEFFPYDMSPFGYNETVANDFFLISKEIISANGYNWKDPKERNYNITKDSTKLPDAIKEVSEDILDEIISCPNHGNPIVQCTTAFKITPAELQFYKQKNLPLPRYCPNCRHYKRLSFMNSPIFYNRTCMCKNTTHNHQGKCTTEFETSYAPEREEIIYCEECYNKEIY
jgi:hypothetical protein